MGIAGHDLNDDLTVVAVGTAEALARLEPDHPARPFLLDVAAAAQRCARKTAAMLDYASRKGVRASAAHLERVLSQEAP
jgi:hypothetical protein